MTTILREQNPDETASQVVSRFQDGKRNVRNKPSILSAWFSVYPRVKFHHLCGNNADGLTGRREEPGGLRVIHVTRGNMKNRPLLRPLTVSRATCRRIRGGWQAGRLREKA